MGYPIQLTGLRGKRAFVAGAGPVAVGKIEALLEAGAMVHVVARSPFAGGSDPTAPSLMARIDRFEQREALAEDVDGAAIVIAATDDPALNRRLSERARALGILVNAVVELGGKFQWWSGFMALA